MSNPIPPANFTPLIRFRQQAYQSLDHRKDAFFELLDAVIVNPAQREVFPLDFEPILNADGAQKNDCERNAAKRLCAALASFFSSSGGINGKCFHRREQDSGRLD
jgi:hypothetical protein